MDSLEYGQHYPMPLEAGIYELFNERMQDRKRFIGAAHFVIENYDSHVEINLRTPEHLWISEYVFMHRQGKVTSKEVVFAGFPSSRGVKDLLNPVQKALRFLGDEGLPIAVTGGRQNRVYHIPNIIDATVAYIEDPAFIKKLDSRFRVPEGFVARASEKSRQVIQSIEAYRLPQLAHQLNDVFPISKRVRSKCRGVDPNLFVSENEKDIATAKQICATCSVAESCLAFGRNGNHMGVWGGVYLNGASKDIEQ